MKLISILSALLLFHTNIIHAQNESLTIDLDKDGVMDKVWIEESNDKYRLVYTLSSLNGKKSMSKKWDFYPYIYEANGNLGLGTTQEGGDIADGRDNRLIFEFSNEKKELDLRYFLYDFHHCQMNENTVTESEKDFNSIPCTEKFLQYDLLNQEYEMLIWNRTINQHAPQDLISEFETNQNIRLLDLWKKYNGNTEDIQLQKEKYSFNKKIYLSTFDEDVQLELEEILEFL